MSTAKTAAVASLLVCALSPGSWAESWWDVTPKTIAPEGVQAHLRLRHNSGFNCNILERCDYVRDARLLVSPCPVGLECDSLPHVIEFDDEDLFYQNMTLLLEPGVGYELSGSWSEIALDLDNEQECIVEACRHDWSISPRPYSFEGPGFVQVELLTSKGSNDVVEISVHPNYTGTCNTADDCYEERYGVYVEPCAETGYCFGGETSFESYAVGATEKFVVELDPKRSYTVRGWWTSVEYPREMQGGCDYAGTHCGITERFPEVSLIGGHVQAKSTSWSQLRARYR